MKKFLYVGAILLAGVIGVLVAAFDSDPSEGISIFPTFFIFLAILLFLNRRSNR